MTLRKTHGMISKTKTSPGPKPPASVGLTVLTMETVIIYETNP